MNNMKKAMVIAGTSFAFLAAVGVASNQVGASEYTEGTSEWVARTVEQVQSEVATDDSGAVSYTIKWGDTLSVIAEATKISLDSLVQINDISNANLIYPGTVMVLSPDQATVSVSDTTGETQTYDVSSQETSTEVVEQPVEQPAEQAAPAETAPASTGNTSTAYSLTVEATAYSYQEAGLTNFTADGTNLLNEPNVIAVDPSVIPLGTYVEIPGYGVYRAADTGGAIVGNKIDIHFNSVQEALNFGRRTITINILN